MKTAAEDLVCLDTSYGKPIAGDKPILRHRCNPQKTSQLNEGRLSGKAGDRNGRPVPFSAGAYHPDYPISGSHGILIPEMKGYLRSITHMPERNDYPLQRSEVGQSRR